MNQAVDIQTEKSAWPTALDERYQCRETLTVGRMSTLFRASPCGDGERDVAIRVLHAHLRDNEAVRHRLRRELAATRRLSHPAIARIEEQLETDDVVALVMEYVDGRSVRQLVRDDGPQSWATTQAIVDQILDAIAHAHGRGIWHRDLNANHVLVTDDGEAKIIGFGMARVDELVGMTMHTRILGALEAMAPERVLGRAYDGRADLYSAGAIAWELVAGKPPIDGTMGDAFAHANRGTTDVSTITGDVPLHGRYVLERALARDASTRFATAHQMQRALHGDYDTALWNTWSGRQTDHCPSCEAPVVDGLGACIQCGHEFRRLVQQPGAGSSMVKIVSPKQAFTPDVWFEHNPEPNHLRPEQYEELMSLLRDYEDTEPFADGRWEFYWPPYILVDQITDHDATRILDELDERDIPAIRTDRPDTGFLSSLIPGQSLGLRGIAFAAIAAIMAGVAAGSGVSIPAIAVGVGLLTATTLVGLAMMAPLQKQLQAIRGVEYAGNHPLMIPAHAISDLGRLTDDRLLPQRTARALGNYEDESLRHEVHELIVLAVAALQQRQRDGEYGAVEKLIDQVLHLADDIDEIEQVLRQKSTAELVRQLESLEQALATDDDAHRCAELIDERSKVLNELDERDELEHRRTILRARLIRVRGALIDLRSQFSTADRDVIGDDTSAFDELRHFVEATAEVEELTT